MFFSFLDDYDRTVSLNDLQFGIQANTTNINIEFVYEVDPLSRFKMVVSSNKANLPNFYRSQPTYSFGRCYTFNTTLYKQTTVKLKYLQTLNNRFKMTASLISADCFRFQAIPTARFL